MGDYSPEALEAAARRFEANAVPLVRAFLAAERARGSPPGLAIFAVLEGVYRMLKAVLDELGIDDRKTRIKALRKLQGSMFSRFSAEVKRVKRETGDG